MDLKVYLEEKKAEVIKDITPAKELTKEEKIKELFKSKLDIVPSISTKDNVLTITIKDPETEGDIRGIVPDIEAALTGEFESVKYVLTPETTKDKSIIVIMLKK